MDNKGLGKYTLLELVIWLCKNVWFWLVCRFEDLRSQQKGAGTSEVFFIIAVVVYFLFMGYVGNAAGYTAPAIGSISQWSVPYVNTSYGWLTATLDFFIAVINIFAWIIGSLVSYIAMIGYGVQGNLPVWMTAFLFVPLSFGLGWVVMSMVRGRE